MSIYDTILVDGTDLSSSTRIVELRDGSYVGPEARGELLTYPGRDGETNVDQPFGPLVFSVGLIVSGTSFTGLNDEYRILRQLCKAGRTVTLTKQMAYTAGNESYTALGKLLRITPARISPIAMRCMVDFTVLDGLWYGSALPVSVGLGAGTATVSVAGDVRSQRMSVTFDLGGANPTLVNTTNGYSLTYTGSTSGTPVVIDVEAMTATQGIANVTAGLSWTKGLPFRLDPGSNVLTCSSSRTLISYNPAYL